MAKKRSGTSSGNGKGRPPSSGGSGYEVGYGKPPKKNQFKKGISGNPRGRQRTRLRRYDPVKGLSNVLTEPIKLRQGDKTVKMSFVEALARTQLKRALEGDARAALTLIKIMKETNLLRPRLAYRIANTDTLSIEELEVLQKLFQKMAGEKDTDSNEPPEADDVEYDFD